LPPQPGTSLVSVESHCPRLEVFFHRSVKVVPQLRSHLSSPALLLATSCTPTSWQQSPSMSVMPHFSGPPVTSPTRLQASISWHPPSLVGPNFPCLITHARLGRQDLKVPSGTGPLPRDPSKFPASSNIDPSQTQPQPRAYFSLSALNSCVVANHDAPPGGKYRRITPKD